MESPAKEEVAGELAMEIESSVTAEDWRRALSRVVPAVAVLRTTAPRAFDTEVAGASYATGFVVDKARGIILTNRHVVKPGPVVAEAMFVNREEIPVYPLYRDPVHDFGFFRYDPGAIKFLKYDEIPLDPEAASVGLEIRVVGNDSGEKVNLEASLFSCWVAAMNCSVPLTAMLTQGYCYPPHLTAILYWIMGTKHIRSLLPCLWFFFCHHVKQKILHLENIDLIKKTFLCMQFLDLSNGTFQHLCKEMISFLYGDTFTNKINLVLCRRKKLGVNLPDSLSPSAISHHILQCDMMTFLRGFCM